MLDLDYLLTLEKDKKHIQKDKKLYLIREKMNKTLSFSELLYLRKFCKKHGYRHLYYALGFDNFYNKDE